MLTTLAGPDLFGKYQRIRELVGGLPVVRLDGEAEVGAWQAALGQADLFGKLPAVVAADVFAMAEARKREVAALLMVASRSEQRVVVQVDGWPKKDGLVDVLKVGQVEELPELTQGQLVKWLVDEAGRMRVNLERAAAVRLVEVFGADRWAMWTELQKWSMAPGREITRAMVEEVDWSAVGGTSFALAEAWAGRQVARSLEQLEEAFRRGEEAQALIGLLERQVRLLRICFLLVSGDEVMVAKRLGVPPFVLGKLRQTAKRWDEFEVERALKLLYELDLGIKTGKIEGTVGLELWVVDTIGRK